MNRGSGGTYALSWIRRYRRARSCHFVRAPAFGFLLTHAAGSIFAHRVLEVRKSYIFDAAVNGFAV